MENFLSKTLVTGAGGAIGSYVNFGLRTTRHDFDITNIKQGEKIFSTFKPKCVLHLAAETDVFMCEQNPLQAYRVNMEGVLNIAVLSQKYDAKVVFISTGAVFDGTKRGPYKEGDIPNPVNVYGRTKFLGEMIVKDLVKDHLIVRTAWVFGGGPEKDHKFIGQIIRQLMKDDYGYVRAVDDKIASPTYGKDLIGAIKKLMRTNVRGVIHVVNKGKASRYDMAEVIVRMLRPGKKVEKVKSGEFDRGILERSYSEVMSSRIVQLRPWQDALRAYINEEWLSVVNPANPRK